MKKIFFALSITLSVFSFCQEKDTIAVFDFAEVNVEQGVGVIPADFCRTYIFKSEKYELISRENMELIFNELKLQETGCTSEECYVELGKMLLAKKILAGKIFKIENVYFVSITLMDVGTAKIDYSDKMKVDNIEELDITCRNLIEHMLNAVFSGEHTLFDSEGPSGAEKREGRIKEIISGSSVLIDKGIRYGLEEKNLVYFFSGDRKIAAGLISQINKDSSRVRILYKLSSGKLDTQSRYFIPFKYKTGELLRNNALWFTSDSSAFIHFTYEKRRFLFKFPPVFLSLSGSICAEKTVKASYMSLDLNLMLFGAFYAKLGPGIFINDMLVTDAVTQEGSRELVAYFLPNMSFYFYVFPTLPVNLRVGIQFYLGNVRKSKTVFSDAPEYPEYEDFSSIRTIVSLGFQY